MQYAWHVHHEKLIELLTEPIENRIAYIRENKPPEEIETRLRLLKPVKGSLPEAVIEAGAAYNEAWAAYSKAEAAYYEATADYDKATADCIKAEAAYVKARAAYYETYVKAWAAYNKAGATYGIARAAYYEALANNMPAIEELHRQECPDCLWNGKTIFPG